MKSKKTSGRPGRHAGSKVTTAVSTTDVLSGAAAIAEFLFGDPKQRRRVYHLADAERGQDKLPCFRLGGTLCARKSTLQRWIEIRESGGVRQDDHARASA